MPKAIGLQPSNPSGLRGAGRNRLLLGSAGGQHAVLLPVGLSHPSASCTTALNPAPVNLICASRRVMEADCRHR